MSRFPDLDYMDRLLGFVLVEMAVPPQDERWCNKEGDFCVTPGRS